jgi:ABC-type multidrug transport system fused ATPase/permease subunit
MGILGRTGSGKSSLVQALLRMYELESDGGQILVDGVDVTDERLVPRRAAFRRRVAVIPQQPVLFSGTVRDNLLPYDEEEQEAGGSKGQPLRASADDAAIWAALRACRMEERVRAMPAGLDSPLLKRSPLVVLDEATASVDLQSDRHIQALTLQLPATVLLVAHRLHTIMHMDRVIVMHQGRVAECDAPYVLAQRMGSMFAQLLLLAQAQQTTGEETALEAVI